MSERSRWLLPVLLSMLFVEVVPDFVELEVAVPA
jgi:hypothetical protein